MTFIAYGIIVHGMNIIARDIIEPLNFLTFNTFVGSLAMYRQLYPGS